MGPTPGQGTKIPHAIWRDQKKRKKLKDNALTGQKHPAFMTTLVGNLGVPSLNLYVTSHQGTRFQLQF